VETNERETAVLVPIYHKASTTLKGPYVDAVLADMQTLGYDLETIDIRRPRDLVVNVLLAGEVQGVSVKERGILGFVDQTAISQGMFRVLSLVAQVNYYAMMGKKGCILVDDIGEGLDFERSCAIIDLLRAKARQFGFQLIMSSNDRFVMNKVPLDEWCVLQRRGNRVRVRNYQNSRESFDEFKFTGLGNFDFFATDFLEEEEAQAAP
jgi:hypothetical protein